MASFDIKIYIKKAKNLKNLVNVLASVVENATGKKVEVQVFNKEKEISRIIEERKMINRKLNYRKNYD